MQEYLTAKEIAKKLGVSRVAIVKRAQREAWPYVEERSERGKPQKKFPISALPEDIRFQLGYINNVTQNVTIKEQENQEVTPDNVTHNVTKENSGYIIKPIDTQGKKVDLHHFENKGGAEGGAKEPAKCNQLTDENNKKNLKEGFFAPLNEVVQLLGVSKWTVRRRCQQGIYRYKIEKTKGGEAYFIDLFSLPPDVQRKFLEKQFGEIPTVEDTQAIEPSLSPKDLRDSKMLKKIKAAQFIKSLPRGAREEAAKMLADLYGKSRATIWRWVAEAEKAKKTKEDLLPRTKSFSKEAVAFGLALMCRNPRAGKKNVYRVLEQKAQEKGWQIGDYTSWTRLLKHVPEEVWTYVKEGELGFELKHVPKIIVEWSKIPVQSIICGDQKILDWIAYDPETDELVILNAYIWMDCSSRFINGAWIELGHYNSFTVGYSLREALRYGIPDEIFTDWGKAEGSWHIKHIRKAIQDVCYTGKWQDFSDQYHIHHRKAQPLKPWKKPIESIMNQIDWLLKGKFLPGYRKRQENPWENKQVQKKLKEQAKAGEILTVEQMIDVFFSCIEEYNNREKKLDEGKTIVPAKFFKEGLRKRPVLKLPDTTLDFITLPTYERVPKASKVQVKIMGEVRFYWSPKLAGHERVYVSVDPYGREAPAVITDMDKNFVDLAEPVPHAVPGERDERVERFFKVRAEYMKEVRHKARQLQDGLGLVDKKEVIAIGKVAKTAKKAQEEKQIRDEEKKEAQKWNKVLELEAKKEKKKLFKEENKEKVQVQGFRIPDDPRERYKLWKELDKRRDELTDEELAFWTHFQESADFRAYRMLEEDFGDVFLGEG